MEVRSLGYRTDLAIAALEGSQVNDRGDYLVIRTPGNPDYWWGNFLLLPDLEPGSGRGWLARFAAEFPDARHVALGLDEPEAGAVDPGELAGMTMERIAVMTAASVRPPPHPNTDAVFRILAGDADWRQSLELAAAVHAGEPGGDAGFLTARLAARRALTEAGHGAWLGAFLDGALVAQLGLVTVESGLARYQNVETHPAARRRGLAGTLVWQAGLTALTSGTRVLVMVADPEDAAIRVYRSGGFTVAESQLSFIRRPAQSLPCSFRTTYRSSIMPKSIAVFGAGPGLGQAVARRYAREGYAVTLVGRRAEPLDRLAKDLTSAGATAHVITADLSDTGATPRLAGQIRAKAGNLDAFYYAPTPATGFVPAASLTPQHAQAFMPLIFYTMLALVQEFLPHMLEQGNGAILTAQGGSTVQGLPHMSGPSPAQAAQRNYLQALHAEVADKGVYVGMLYIGAAIKNSAFHAEWEESKAAGEPTWEMPTVDPGQLAGMLWAMHAAKGQREAIYP